MNGYGRIYKGCASLGIGAEVDPSERDTQRVESLWNFSFEEGSRSAPIGIPPPRTIPIVFQQVSHTGMGSAFGADPHARLNGCTRGSDTMQNEQASDHICRRNAPERDFLVVPKAFAAVPGSNVIRWRPMSELSIDCARLSMSSSVTLQALK